jgi:hypothetical protein
MDMMSVSTTEPHNVVRINWDDPKANKTFASHLAFLHSVPFHNDFDFLRGMRASALQLSAAESTVPGRRGASTKMGLDTGWTRKKTQSVYFNVFRCARGRVWKHP